MADLKISQLNAITVLTPATDVLPVVDSGGVTKKITTNQILGSGGTATLASATITGALTVDTTTLVVDPTNDRVGIGTATPAAKLIVRDGSNRNLLVSSDATQLGSAGIAIGSFTDNAAGYAPLSIIAGTSMAFGMNGSTAMTLNSTGLGVGVVPSVAGENIYVRKDQAAYTSIIVRNDNTLASGTGCGFTLIDGGVNAGWFRRQRDGSGNTDIGYKDSLRFRGAITGTERTDMTIDTSGNVGIGVTPSAWGGSNRAALQFPGGNAIQGSAAIGLASFNNCFNNGTNDICIANGTTYKHVVGTGYQWFIGTGTAGNSFSFGDAKMTLDASGRLLVGGTGPFGIPNGAGTSFFPLIQTITTSGSAAVSAFVNDGTNNRRIGLFVDNDNGITGISVGRSGGSAPFVYRDATDERLRIDTFGNLITTVPTTPPTLAANSQMVFNLTSNTNLRISVRGTDGVTRTANLTLAP